MNQFYLRLKMISTLSTAKCEIIIKNRMHYRSEPAPPLTIQYILLVFITYDVLLQNVNVIMPSLYKCCILVLYYLFIKMKHRQT